MPRLAPVALFAYARPAHIRRTVDALRANTLAARTDLIVFADQASRPELQPAVDAVRAYAKTITGFNSVRVVERELHQGLARSVTAGITSVLNQSDRIIVLEDDIVTAPRFLEYMNAGLERFAGEERVMHIAAYGFPVKPPHVLPPAFFFRATMCWGWATWAGAWRHYQPDAAALLQSIERRGAAHEFDVKGTHPYTNLLALSAAGDIDSWAIRWYASVFLAGGLCLHPGRSFVQNIGFDGSGSHDGQSKIYDVVMNRDASLPELDIAIVESEPALRLIMEFYRRSHPSYLQRAAARLRGWARALTTRT